MLKQIKLPEEYELIEGQLKCLHVNWSIEKACCSAFQMLIECACQGMDEIVCSNPKCTGVTDEDVDKILYGDQYAG